MATSATALVQFGPEEFGFEEIAFPRLERGAALVRVEANGLCYSDVDSYYGQDIVANTYPRIIGHEIVGVVEDLGPAPEARSDLRVGDRVAVGTFLGCGRCGYCQRGDTALCASPAINPFGRNSYGRIPTTVEPGLWGGYATHVYAHPNAVLYKFPEQIDALDATLFQPIAAGFHWGVENGNVGVGTKILILGSGQRGLASIFATRAAGASVVAVTGLNRDTNKLALALELGADAAINVETEDVIARAQEITMGTGFDVILDTTPNATQPILDAFEMVTLGGTIVLAGIKNRTIDGFPIDRAIAKRVRIIASRGSTNDAFQKAVDLIASQKYPVHKLRTHVLGYDKLEDAVHLLEGKVPDAHPINVVVTPTMSS